MLVTPAAARDYTGAYQPYNGNTDFIEEIVDLDGIDDQELQYQFFFGVVFSVYRIISNETCVGNRCISVICLNLEQFCRYNAAVRAGPALVIGGGIDRTKFALLSLCDSDTSEKCIDVSLGKRGAIVTLGERVEDDK